MHIILLSGGSGKRLWPLSNDVRSKQFLKLLIDENGQKQSMVQRVFRQINEAQPGADIVIATSSSQVDAIKGQLGDAIDIVLEPERRDTFPAIALASAYLSLKKRIEDEDVVLVLPIDTYTDIEYFTKLNRLENAVKEGLGDIVLMGVKPTFPSPKYGYIVPDSEVAEGVYRVSRFKEKPEYKEAKKLISQGAVWNGGVFAFKLGYIMDIVRKQVHFTTYEDLYGKFPQLEKTSFDYKVVESAASVAMVKYEGEWNDLGTWATITGKMDSEGLGIVSLGECENTFAVNELGIPLLVMGAKDMVVAASPDGILVSDINSSARIKPYVDGFQSNGHNGRPMFEERRWGEYTVFYNTSYEDGTKSLTKHLMLKPGKSISYQLHHFRDEVWIITNGTADLILDADIKRVGAGDVILIKREQKHSIKAISNLHLIEVQIGTRVLEEDIERFSDVWQQ